MVGQNLIKNIFTLLAVFLGGLFLFTAFEPVLLKAVSDSDDVLVSLDITGEITISDASDIVLSALSGMTGGTSTSGAITWNVNTSAVGGYTLTIEKDHLLYTNGGGADKQIADYTEASAGTPDYDWDAVGAGNEEFGFAPSAGADIVQKFKNSGGVCNQAAGTVSDLQCWSPIPTTATQETLATSASGTGESGTDTSIKVRAEVGTGNYLESGTYTSTITATAATNE